MRKGKYTNSHFLKVILYNQALPKFGTSKYPKINVLKYKIPLFYCNAVGSQTEIVFDGGKGEKFLWR